MLAFLNLLIVIFKTYSDLEDPTDIRVWKMSSEVPSSTPTAIITGWLPQLWIQQILDKETINENKFKVRSN